MTILDKHIGVYVVQGTLLALLVLLALFSSTEFVEDLDSVGKGEYTVARAIEHLALTMPQRAFVLFPMAALLGSLVSLGILASNSELIVMRAAGVSLGRITISVMKAGAVLMAIAVVVGELLAPWTETLAQHRRSIALNKQTAVRIDEGFWVRDGSSFINARQVLSDERMTEIYIYEFDDSHRLRVATYASGARYEDDEWVLEGLKQSVISADGVVRRELSKASWSSPLQPELVNVITVKPESLSPVELYRYLGYLSDNGLSTERYELALWKKLISPLATGVMIFLAIPLVLGKLRTVGIGQRLMVGILVGIGFHVVQETAGPMGIVYGLTPLVSAAAPTLLFLMVGLWLIRQVR